MGDSILGKQTMWGWGIETTVGTAVDPTEGLANFNKDPIKPGQEWIEDAKATGFTVLHTDEIYDGNLLPTWSPETSMTFPGFGKLMYLLCQKGAETGAGPYIQTIEPDINSGKDVDLGDSVGAGQLTYSCKAQSDQTSSRDVRVGGGVVKQIDVTFTDGGLVKVTPQFMFLTYANNVAAAGTYTLPGQSVEKMTRDFVWKIGNSPVALYSPEITLSFMADIVVKRYGGLNTTNAGGPFRFCYNGWSVSGSFSKPIIAGTDTLSKSHVVASGVDQLLYIYSNTLTDYNESTATWGNGEMRFTLNIKLDDAITDYADELKENVTFKGAYDGSSNIFKYEQVTTATQAAWCA